MRCIFHLGRIDNHTLSSGNSAVSAWQMEMLSDLVRGIFFQLYHSIGERRTAYADGIFEKREYSTVDKEKHGTTVEYQPDPQFFQHPEVNITEIKKLFEDISALCPNLYTELYIDDKLTEFHSANGIADLVDKKVAQQ